jgi:hypothetical protein
MIEDKKMSLMSFEEMKRRYDGGEDSLELTLEKWERILKQSNAVYHIVQYQEILRAAVVPIFLCTEYSNQCHMCPIYNVCNQGHSDDWTKLMRVVQAYAIAGDVLPKDPLMGQLAMFVDKLKLCRSNIFDKLN